MCLGMNTCVGLRTHADNYVRCADNTTQTTSLVGHLTTRKQVHTIWIAFAVVAYMYSETAPIIKMTLLDMTIPLVNFHVL